MNRWRLVACESRTARKKVDTRAIRIRPLLSVKSPPIFGVTASQVRTGDEQRRVHQIGRHTDGATAWYGEPTYPDKHQYLDTFSVRRDSCDHWPRFATDPLCAARDPPEASP